MPQQSKHSHEPSRRTWVQIPTKNRTQEDTSIIAARLQGQERWKLNNPWKEVCRPSTLECLMANKRPSLKGSEVRISASDFHTKQHVTELTSKYINYTHKICTHVHTHTQLRKDNVNPLPCCLLGKLTITYHTPFTFLLFFKGFVLLSVFRRTG